MIYLNPKNLQLLQAERRRHRSQLRPLQKAISGKNVLRSPRQSVSHKSTGTHSKAVDSAVNTSLTTRDAATETNPQQAQLARFFPEALSPIIPSSEVHSQAGVSFRLEPTQPLLKQVRLAVNHGLQRRHSQKAYAPRVRRDLSPSVNKQLELLRRQSQGSVKRLREFKRVSLYELATGLRVNK